MPLKKGTNCWYLDCIRVRIKFSTEKQSQFEVCMQMNADHTPQNVRSVPNYKKVYFVLVSLENRPTITIHQSFGLSVEDKRK